jgi:hypothetical protein
MSFKTNVPNIELETGEKIIYPFSPPIFQTEVDTNFTKELIEEGRKLTKEEDDFNQFGTNYKQINDLLNIQHDRRQLRQGNLRLDTLWINFSQKHDFNPPHNHTGVLSFVIFCQVPKEIFKVQADSNTQRAGEIHFQCGEPITKLVGSEYPVKPYENLMFIFPAELKHFVPAYWVDAERISVSGNFVVV